MVASAIIVTVGQVFGQIDGALIASATSLILLLLVRTEGEVVSGVVGGWIFVGMPLYMVALLGPAWWIHPALLDGGVGLLLLSLAIGGTLAGSVQAIWKGYRVFGSVMLAVLGVFLPVVWFVVR